MWHPAAAVDGVKSPKAQEDRTGVIGEFATVHGHPVRLACEEQGVTGLTGVTSADVGVVMPAKRPIMPM